MAALIARRSNASKAPCSSDAPLLSPGNWVSPWARLRPVAAPTEISPRRWVSRLLMASAPSATERIPLTNTCLPRPCPSVPHSSPLSSPLRKPEIRSYAITGELLLLCLTRLSWGNPTPRICHSDRSDGRLCGHGAEESLLNFGLQAKSSWVGTGGPRTPHR